MQLLISDTNILIDMEEGELLTLFFDLPYKFCVPDVLYYEELEHQHSHLRDLGLGLKELSAESLSRVSDSLPLESATQLASELSKTAILPFCRTAGVLIHRVPK